MLFIAIIIITAVWLIIAAIIVVSITVIIYARAAVQGLHLTSPPPTNRGINASGGGHGPMALADRVRACPPYATAVFTLART